MESLWRTTCWPLETDTLCSAQPQLINPRLVHLKWLASKRRNWNYELLNCYRKGNVFTPVCDSVDGGGCGRGGVRSREHAWQGGCVAGGGGVHGRGMCGGNVHGGGHA